LKKIFLNIASITLVITAFSGVIQVTFCPENTGSEQAFKQLVPGELQRYNLMNLTKVSIADVIFK
jgi:hypothetical protein